MKIGLPEDDSAGFQMAPMIDIVFQLIIFFMVAANWSRQEHVPVQIPLAAHAERPRDASNRGNITVKKDGVVYAGTQPLAVEGVKDLIAESVRVNPNFKVFLRADRGAKHRDVRAVMKACAEAGVADIIFSTYQED